MDELNELTIKKIQSALKLVEAHRKASEAYHNRKRQEKKDSGTYKGRGRPRKVEPV